MGKSQYNKFTSVNVSSTKVAEEFDEFFELSELPEDDFDDLFEPISDLVPGLSLDNLQQQVNFQFDEEIPRNFFIKKNCFFNKRNIEEGEVVVYVNKKGVDRHQSKTPYVRKLLIEPRPSRIMIDLELISDYNITTTYWKKGEEELYKIIVKISPKKETKSQTTGGFSI